jgi:uncharacterized RDD family membrane protein YckC
MRSGASDPDGRLSQPDRVPSPGTPAYAYAGLASRLIALAVDVALLTIAGLFVSVLPGLAWSQVVGDPPGWFTAACAVIASVLPWAYFTVAWWLGGQTAGGLLVGTRVARTHGQRPLLVQAALRALIGLLLVPLWLIGLAWVLWDPRRRAWHDIVFRTVVLRTIESAQPAMLSATATARSTHATRGTVPAGDEQAN